MVWKIYNNSIHLFEPIWVHVSRGGTMSQILKSKLDPTDSDRIKLNQTFQNFNTLCNDISPVAHNLGTANIIEITKACYNPMRKKYPNMASQLIVRAIAKVAGKLAQNKKASPYFHPNDAVILDSKLLTFKHLDEVSIMTIEGRIRIPYSLVKYKPCDRKRPHGYTELYCDNHTFYLETVVN